MGPGCAPHCRDWPCGGMAFFHGDMACHRRGAWPWEGWGGAHCHRVPRREWAGGSAQHLLNAACGPRVGCIPLPSPCAAPCDHAASTCHAPRHVPRSPKHGSGVVCACRGVVCCCSHMLQLVGTARVTLPTPLGATCHCAPAPCPLHGPQPAGSPHVGVGGLAHNCRVPHRKQAWKACPGPCATHSGCCPCFMCPFHAWHAAAMRPAWRSGVVCGGRVMGLQGAARGVGRGVWAAPAGCSMWPWGRVCPPLTPPPCMAVGCHMGSQCGERTLCRGGMARQGGAQAAGRGVQAVPAVCSMWSQSGACPCMAPSSHALHHASPRA